MELYLQSLYVFTTGQLSTPTTVPANFLLWRNPYNNFTYPEEPPVYDKVYRLAEVASGDSSSTAAKLLSTKFICEDMTMRKKYE